MIANKSYDDTADNQDLFDKVGNHYLKGLKNSMANYRTDGTFNNQDTLAVIIHILAVLTGYPENQINPATRLNTIGLTPIKRERARQRINAYLRDNGSNAFITSTEMNNCNTVTDILNLVNLKTA